MAYCIGTNRELTVKRELSGLIGSDRIDSGKLSFFCKKYTKREKEKIKN